MAKRLVPFGSLNGTSPTYRYFLVNDSMTIVAGDVVVMNTGKLDLAGDAAGVGTVVGVAAEGIVTTTATAADKILVDINPAIIYKAPYTGTGPAVVGTKYDMGTAGYEVDLDDTTGGYMQAVPDNDALGYNTTEETMLIILCNRLYGLA
jgi:hypothetical protein